ncbi:MAG: hypothetical protein ACLQUY_00355 [Ktedonobacterales bacterium]
MAEELFDHDDNEQRSALSGELGSPGATWLRWLSGTTGEGRPPATGERMKEPPLITGSGLSLVADDRAVSRDVVDEVDDVDGIYEHPTVPLEPPDPFSNASAQEAPNTDQRAAPPQRTLFEQRYLEEPWTKRPNRAPETSNPRSTRLPRSPRRSRGSTGDAFASFHSDLQERRAEDERLTGRRWPGNGIPYPGSQNEAMFFDQLAIALGEVDPRVLARESALRYVRASRLPDRDDLGPTDIYAIFYYGLGLSLRPLNCTGLPYVLGTYSRLMHELYLDWTLLQDPPYGRAALDQTAWRRTLDSSPVARILLAWCAATHLAENYDVPLVLGFSGYAAPMSSSGQTSALGAFSLSPAGVAGDVLNRYRKTIIAFATLLAPPERLWQQISALRLGIHMGDPEWRAHVRAICSLDGSGGGWRQAEVTGHLMPGGFWYPRDMDPVEQLVTILAERNSCPPSIIEWQLDGNPGVLDWDTWSMQLLRDVPALQQRYALAERFLFSGTPRGSGVWSLAGFGPDIQVPLLRLSF